MLLRRVLPTLLLLTPLAAADPVHASGTDSGQRIAGSGAAATQTVRVVEFHNAAQDHYFITADAREIADLDGGAHPGWRRTGLAFDAFASDVAGTSAVCRFYIPPAWGDSHFYSASPAECDATRTNYPGFDYESSAAFHVVVPDRVSGACPEGTIPVYRLWNGRADSNHRYTTERTVWQQMRDIGWIAEGFGDDQVVMCSSSATGPPTDLEVVGRAVIKARAAGDRLALLEERPTSILEPGPDRTLALVQADGRPVRDYAPPPGWSLADFAVHPSGDISLALTSDDAVRIVRLNADALVQSDAAFVDPAAASDPYLDYGGGVEDDAALQPVLMHDAAQLAALGESVALVLRTGRNAVVAYRLDPDASGAYHRAWRTLVEPGSSIFGVFLSSGSFDSFEALENHVALHVDADAAGTLAIGVIELPFRNFAFQAHAQYFGEAITAQAGVLVTRIAGDDGRRLGSTVIDTGAQAELHAVRATAHGFMLVGRILPEVKPDGSGWDAFVARVASDGAVASYRVVDVDRGDALFDIAALSGGRTLALGTTGYIQNPSGASISEETQPLLLLLDADGSVAGRIDVPDGPRQDQLRTIVPLDDRWLVGGMRNGPGTHSGDGRPDLITADGFLREMSGLPTP